MEISNFIPFSASTIFQIGESIEKNSSLVICSKERSSRLAYRVTTLLPLVKPLLSTGSKDPRLISALILFKSCLDDIDEYIMRLCIRDKHLAFRLLKHGTDEEEFVKMNERLHHAVIEMKIGPKAVRLFNTHDDDLDFERDYKFINDNYSDLLQALQPMVISDKARAQSISAGVQNANTLMQEPLRRDPQIEMKRMLDNLENLIKEQNEKRLSYRTKRAPDATLMIDESDLSFDEIIGRGGFGVVWKGRYKGEAVAIKKIHSQFLSPIALQSFELEANIMRRLSHSRIVQCFGMAISNETPCMLVMEYLEKGSLWNYILNNPKEENWSCRRAIALDIAEGMHYLHRLRIIHRDLKSSNVVLDASLRAKVTDFGYFKF